MEWRYRIDLQSLRLHYSELTGLSLASCYLPYIFHFKLLNQDQEKSVVKRPAGKCLSKKVRIHQKKEREVGCTVCVCVCL